MEKLTTTGEVKTVLILLPWLNSKLLNHYKRDFIILFFRRNSKSRCNRFFIYLINIPMLRKFIAPLRRNRPLVSCKQTRFCAQNRSKSEEQIMSAVEKMMKLGYTFNSNGQLRKINNAGQAGDEPFQFNVSDQHHECQAHYEKLGEAVTDYVYHLLETETKLTKLPVPKTDKNGTFIFASNDYNKKDTLVVLIHGSGAVRAGQWARSLIINENLEMGTQIPYIKKALAKDYGVLVLNTNDNCTAEGKEIKNSDTAEEHANYVWKTYISNTKAQNIVIVAHSYGGVVTVSLADQLKSEFEKRVKAIAFTDSVHGYSNIKITDFMKKVAKNWISSREPLDTPMKTPEFDILRVSSGTQKHEMTSHSCIESVFKFIEQCLKN